MQQINTSGFKGWNNIKHHEFYEAYRSETNSEVEIEVYFLDYIPQNDMAGYEFRMQNSHPFVPQIIDIITPQTSKQAFTKVVIEHTQMRLDQCRSLPDKPIELIVAEVFIGFEAIFKQYGPFKVKQNMIGFDNKGNAKVWLNCNFAKNHMNPFDILKANRENLMIKNIFDLFQPFGYCLQREVFSFDEAKTLVMSNLMNKGLETSLSEINWKRSSNPKPHLILQRNHLQSVQIPSYNYKTRSSTDSKKYAEVIQSTSSKTLSTKSKKDQQKQLFLRSSMQNRTSNFQQIPTYIDLTHVRQYLSNPNFSLNSKLMYISYLRQNPISDQINDLINIFEFAIQKDSNLYSMLVQIKGDIESNSNIFFQSKILKIKDWYNGESVEPHRKPSQDQRRFSESHIFYAPEQRKQTIKTLEQLLNNNSAKNIQSPTSPKQDDLIQTFDQALQRFVKQKQKIKSNHDLAYVKKSSPTTIFDNHSHIPLDKRTTGISQKWQIDNAIKDQIIEDKMKMKQKNFAGLKEEAARILDL